LGSLRRGFFGTALRRFWARSVGAAFLVTFLRAAFFGTGFRVDFLGAAFLATTFLRTDRLTAFFFAAGFF
jgi:hypothetical protein